MIDITVDDNHTRVEIENKEYTIASQQSMIQLIHDIIDKAKYSGESITLWRAEKDKKYLIDEW